MSVVSPDHNEQPLVVFLGGVHGVGKTSLSHQISQKLGIYYQAGLGAIIQTLKMALPNDTTFQTWGQYRYLEKTKLLKKFLTECQSVSPFVQAIIYHAIETGEDYIFDGVQFLPKNLPLENVQYFLITVSDTTQYKQRLEHPTQTKKRHKDTMSLEGEKIIEDLMMAEAKKYNIPVIDNSRPLKFATEEIISYLR